ncbi:MAG: carbohydrate kinase family protein [Gemmataceae bacterium]
MSKKVDVVCAGVIVADHVCAPIPRLPRAGELITTDSMILTIGGCASNCAVDLAKMNVTASVLGRVGDDAFGRIVCQMLAEAGLDTTHVRVSPGRPTSQTMIINVTGEDRRFIHIFGANADFTPSDFPMDQILQARVLYVGGYLIMPGLEQEGLREIFARARQAGVQIVLDVATPGPGDYLSRLERLLPLVDVFLPNEDEARLITGETDPVRQAEAFRRLGARVAVITRGGEGAVLLSERVRLRAGVYPVPFVDGSGGGDAFDAGYIYGLLHRMDETECLRIASALGASCVRALGTTPGVFTESECLRFIREHPLPIEKM